MSDPTVERIQKEIAAAPVVLFVKGTPQAPMCGFSASTMELFKKMNVPFHTVDVLANPEVRRALPQVSNWPTFPQVFIGGKLIGGSDVLYELHENGELKDILKSAGVKV